MFRLSLLVGLTVCFSCGPARPRTDGGVAGSGGIGGVGGIGGIGGGGGSAGTGGTAGVGGAGGGSAGAGGGSAGAGGSGGSSFGWDGGLTVDAVRNARLCERVRIESAVVTGVESVSMRDGGFTGQASFWVADVANQKKGLYVFKNTRGTPNSYLPKVGDLLNLDGVLQRYEGTWDGFAYRLNLREGCRTDAGVLDIQLVDAGAPVDMEVVDAGFGNAMNGNARPDLAYSSARVFIPGPVTITDTRPTPLTRLELGVVDGYNGFTLTGGVLVNALLARTLPDGGACPYRNALLDGGSVTFSSGVSGIWDTYSHSPCQVAGCTFNRDAGYVPGTNNPWTMVLWPLSCDDLPYP